MYYAATQPDHLKKYTTYYQVYWYAVEYSKMKIYYLEIYWKAGGIFSILSIGLKPQAPFSVNHFWYPGTIQEAIAYLVYSTSFRKIMMHQDNGQVYPRYIN